MNTLIVPCAGKSTRFPNMRPKWMLYYPDGKMMVEKAIEGLNLAAFDRVIFTIVKEHAIKYDADAVLNEIFDFNGDNPYELCVLNEFTSCQAETVYLTIKSKRVEGRFSVKDSDNYIGIDTINQSDYIAGININTFPKEIERLGGKSFLLVNEQRIVTDIIEKQIKSENICVGMYGFSDTNLFKQAYEHLSDVSDKTYEIYLSHIISYLIGTKKTIYKYIEAYEYEDWGTIKDWNNMLNEKRSYLINVDDVLIERRESYGKEGWNTDIVLLEDNIAWVKHQIQKGAQIILLSSAPENKREEISRILEMNQISFHQLILGCYLSHEVLVSARDGAIPYPACEAVNIQAKENIKNYL